MNTIIMTIIMLSGSITTTNIDVEGMNNEEIKTEIENVLNIEETAGAVVEEFIEEIKETDERVTGGEKQFDFNNQEDVAERKAKAERLSNLMHNRDADTNRIAEKEARKARILEHKTYEEDIIIGR